MAKHLTQGHLAFTPQLGLTYSGSLGLGMYLALVDESTGGNTGPCASSNVGGASGVQSGPQQAATTTKTAQFDTTNLDLDKNYAICYSEDSTTWHGSAIRTSIARMTSLSYNQEQTGTTSGALPGEYTRVMASSNVYPASDLFPAATNVIPNVDGNLRFTYNVPATGGLAQNQYIALVAADRNSHNPCADATDIAINELLCRLHSTPRTPFDVKSRLGTIAGSTYSPLPLE